MLLLTKVRLSESSNRQNCRSVRIVHLTKSYMKERAPNHKINVRLDGCASHRLPPSCPFPLPWLLREPLSKSGATRSLLPFSRLGGRNPAGTVCSRSPLQFDIQTIIMISELHACELSLYCYKAVERH